MGSRLKKDDKVVVISGKDKGTVGQVLSVDRETDRVIVEGVNKIRRHTRPTPKNPQGGIIEREAPIHACKVMLVDPGSEGTPTRVRMGTDKDGNKVRIAVKSGSAFPS